MNNNELIQQARELCEKATPGPWKSEETADYSEIYGKHSWGKALNPLAMVGSNLEDAAFIAASRAIVPQLCDALEAAEKELIDYHHTQKTVDGKMAENARLRRIIDKLTARAEKAEAKIKSIHESLNFADKSRAKCANYVELAVSNGLALGKIAVAIQHDYDAEPPKGE